MSTVRRICRACARRARFLVNCFRLGPSNARWVLDFEREDDRA